MGELIVMDDENLVAILPGDDAPLQHQPDPQYQAGLIIGMVLGIIYLVFRNL